MDGAKHAVGTQGYRVRTGECAIGKDRLLQRLAARGIQPDLVNWINAFYSGRTATIVVNGQARF